MINEISQITGYQVTTKYYNGVYKTKTDAERINKLMTSLERIIDFAVKNNYLRGVFEIEFPYINTQNGTIDFIINGILAETEPKQYMILKSQFYRYLLTKFFICKIKSIICDDIISKKEVEDFNNLITDINVVFSNTVSDLNAITKLNSIYNDGGKGLIDSCLL